MRKAESIGGKDNESRVTCKAECCLFCCQWAMCQDPCVTTTQEILYTDWTIVQLCIRPEETHGISKHFLLARHHMGMAFSCRLHKLDDTRPFPG